MARRPADLELTPDDFRIDGIGDCRVRSPLVDVAESDGQPTPVFVSDDDRALLEHRTSRLSAFASLAEAPGFELAGPRRSICFDPPKTRVGIVTCGGLCPGINDVIRGLVMEAYHRYGVRRILGFRYGFRGFVPEHRHEVVDLDPDAVSEIHLDGGTILGSSRGRQEPAVIVDCLERMGIHILFVIGGDGTIRGALALCEEIERRGLQIAVVGIPKTIDNDILFIDRSFGFETAYSEAVESILGAHVEAKGAPNGVGLVKLMGREAGFIACHATLAASHVNFCLVREVPFDLEGEEGFLAALEERLRRRHHAVVVVAEGAGQELVEEDGVDGADLDHDASGNPRLHDIGPFLRERILEHGAERGYEVTVKYIDPSYIIRSVPARPPDSVYCWRLAQNAVHAGMCGKTRMVVGLWNGRLVHVPMRLAISGRKSVNPDGALWWSVLESTGQPPLRNRVVAPG